MFWKNPLFLKKTSPTNGFRPLSGSMALGRVRGLGFRVAFGVPLSKGALIRVPLRRQVRIEIGSKRSSLLWFGGPNSMGVAYRDRLD